MPEGPELRMNSMFVNNVCKGLVFAGRPEKSSVSKSCDIPWDSPRYSVASESRGKEMALLLQCLQDKKKKMRILFRFGMSGKFTFTPATMIPKHAHLRFHTLEDKGNKGGERESEVLSFTDVRRFGSWHILASGWGEARGPDMVDEYDDFRSNVLANLEDPVFGKAMCEVMLNQKYFNGVGNYLRAEVLFRARIPPFSRARDALQPLLEKSALETLKGGDPDVLELCRDVSQEVISLKKDLGKHELMTASVSESDHQVFLNWLRCYNNPNMSTMKDKNGRTVWFQGEAGLLAPKGAKVKVGKRICTPDNPNPSAMTTTSVKEEPEECPSPDKGTAVSETDVSPKTEPDVPAKRAKVIRRKITVKVKRAKDPKLARTADAKENTFKSLSVSSRSAADIPAELLRRSARLKHATK